MTAQELSKLLEDRAAEYDAFALDAAEAREGLAGVETESKRLAAAIRRTRQQLQEWIEHNEAKIDADDWWKGGAE